MGHRKIFLYSANIVGYTRVALLLLSFFLHHTHPHLFLVCYGLSFLLDTVDGHVARVRGETSRFGAALDIFTDKLSSPGLMLILSNLYPNYSVILVSVLLLDISSHYFHFYATLLNNVVSQYVPSKNHSF